VAVTTAHVTIIRDDADVTLLVTGDVEPYTPGRTWGPPEHCYPSEGGTAEVTAIELDGAPWRDTLTARERCEAEAALVLAAEEDAHEATIERWHAAQPDRRTRRA
jgi:hypothetical protein